MVDLARIEPGAEVLAEVGEGAAAIQPVERKGAVATRDAGPLVVAEPRQPLGKAIVSVAIRPEKVKLSRRGPAADGTGAQAINRLEGVIADTTYLGGLTVYKVQLDGGTVVRAAMANTARLDMDAYRAGQRVTAWFTPDDCVVLEQ